MTETANRPAVAGLIVALVSAAALGGYVGHGVASGTGAEDTQGTMTEGETSSAVSPDPVITRDAPPIVGDVTAPWQAGWTPSGDDDGDTIPACEREDGPDPCYWDAGERGNGEGRSFVTDADGRVTYLGD